MNENETIAMSREAMGVLLRHVRGSYSHTEWAVVDGAGQRCADARLIPGRFLVVENAYDATILYMAPDPYDHTKMIVTQCKEEE